MANLVGRIFLNQFRVENFISSGGMGSVYRVWDIKRNVSLAMKVLHADLAEDASVYKKFEREAIALRKLAHPHIVPFYGIYKTAEFAFLLEKFIDGPTLKEIIKEKNGNPLELHKTLSYMKALSSALGYAHANGVVHCDVKPGNVMVDQGGNIYLTDFGIVRHADSSTTTIGSAGTPAYMPPEQILGEAVVPATDVYSLGVMLFEMLTGRRPFRGQEVGTEKSGATLHEKIRYAHLNTPPPNPRTINPSISTALADTILRSMNKDLNKRFSSAIDFFSAICSSVGIPPENIQDRVVENGYASASIPGSQNNIGNVSSQAAFRSSLEKKRLVKPWKVAGLAFSSFVVCLVIGLFIIIAPPIINSLSSSTPIPTVLSNISTTSPQTAVPIPSVTEIKTLPNSPTALPKEGMPITLDNIDQIQEVYALKTGEVVIGLSISPDGELVAGGGITGRVKVWRIATQYLEYEVDGKYAAFSPNEEIIGVAGDTGVHLYNSNNGSLIRSFNEGTAYHSILFSPNGKLVAAGASYGEFYVWKVSDGSLVKYGTGLGGDVTSLSFSKDSNLIALASQDKTYVWNLKENKIARSLLSVGKKEKIVYSSVALDSSGDLFATSIEDGTIVLWRVDNGEKVIIIDNKDNEYVKVIEFLETTNTFSTLVSGDLDGLSFWKIEGYSYNKYVIPDSAFVVTFSISPTRKLIATSHEDGTIYIWGVSQ